MHFSQLSRRLYFQASMARSRRRGSCHSEEQSPAVELCRSVKHTGLTSNEHDTELCMQPVIREWLPLVVPQPQQVARNCRVIFRWRSPGLHLCIMTA